MDQLVDALWRQAVTAEAQRWEAVLWDFAVSGAFLNELMVMHQPSTGKRWVQ